MVWAYMHGKCVMMRMTNFNVVLIFWESRSCTFPRLFIGLGLSLWHSSGYWDMKVSFQFREPSKGKNSEWVKQHLPCIGLFNLPIFGMASLSHMCLVPLSPEIFCFTVSKEKISNFSQNGEKKLLKMWNWAEIYYMYLNICIQCVSTA